MGEVQVCVECGTKAAGPGEASSGEVLFATVSDILADPRFDGIEPRRVACLGNCDCDCRLALAHPDKWSWMLGHLHPTQDATFLRDVIALWQAAPNGLIPKTERPQKLTDISLGRIPPVLMQNRKP